MNYLYIEKESIYFKEKYKDEYTKITNQENLTRLTKVGETLMSDNLYKKVELRIEGLPEKESDKFYDLFCLMNMNDIYYIKEDKEYDDKIKERGRMEVMSWIALAFYIYAIIIGIYKTITRS